MAAIAYLVAGTARPRATILGAVQAAINALRVQEGWGNFTFTTLTNGRAVMGFHIAEMRKALSITGTLTVGAQSFSTISSANRQFDAYEYTRLDHPYPTILSDSVSANLFSSSKTVGKSTASGSANTTRLRAIYEFNLPDWYTIGLESSSEVAITLSGILTAIETFVPNVYYYSSDIGVPSISNFNGTGATLLGVLVLNTTPQTLAPAAPTVNGGSKFCLLFVSDKEFAGTGSGGTPGTNAGADTLLSPTSPTPAIVLTF